MIGFFSFNNEEGFGFSDNEEIRSIWKPESIKPGFIKITSLDDNSYFTACKKGLVCFWIRKENYEQVNLLL